VRGTTTILRVFKANAPQFVYQKRRAVRQHEGEADPIPAAPDSRPASPVLPGRQGRSAGPGNRAFTMPPKSRRAKL
jgi:hypothetical protein